MTKLLESVTSHVCLVAAFDGYQYDPSQMTKIIGESNYDLIIYGNLLLPEGFLYSPEFSLKNKIVLGYVNIGESTQLVTDAYVGGVKSYFGNLHPAFENLHSVKYWVPEWWEIVKTQIDDQIAAGFIASEEFQTRYGGAVSDADFITLLYANVLDRTPDQQGFDYWINDMKMGMSHAAVLASFSESEENQRNVFDQIVNGIEYTPFIS